MAVEHVGEADAGARDKVLDRARDQHLAGAGRQRHDDAAVDRQRVVGEPGGELEELAGLGSRGAPRGGGDQLGADGGAPHRQHDHGVDVAEGGGKLRGRRHPAGLRQLARHGRDLREHVLRIDPAQRCGVVEGDRLLEQRRARAVRVVLGIRPARLLVGILVAEEVACVHQVAAAALGRSAPAIRRPSASSASTSPGERAST